MSVHPVDPEEDSNFDSASSMNSVEMFVDNSGGRASLKHRYPYSIVWTPLPLITWFIPFIGHMGICQENGVIRDFQVRIK